MPSTVAKTRPTLAERNYLAAIRALERVRVESRQARDELTQAVMCGYKDILNEPDITNIEDKLAKFLAVQSRLLKAHAKSMEANAMVTGQGLFLKKK